MASKLTPRRHDDGKYHHKSYGLKMGIVSQRQRLDQFAFDNPATFDAVLAERNVHILLVSCASAGHLCFNGGSAAAFSEECGGRLLVVAPISMIEFIG
jgi:hypothetical protein